MYKSETSKVRSSLEKWCKGYGLDLGFGGDKIVPHAIGVDLPKPYAHTGQDPVQLGGDASNLYWFQDSVLDFVYSSHLLEDFVHTTEVLNEWLRVIKPEGHLILFLPDETLYREYCLTTNCKRNNAHAHCFFSANYVKECIQKTQYFTKLIHESKIVHHYSFELVYQKIA